MVTVIVPRSPGTCSHRDGNWGWVRARWEHHHPGWQILEAPDPGTDWSKGRAVASVIARADHDVLVVADADSFADPAALSEAAEMAAVHGWAVPFTEVRRLNEEATAAVTAGPPDTDPPAARSALARGVYCPGPGGGIVAVTREAWDTVGGIDPRFKGWGGEDLAFGWALATLVGPLHRATGPLWHLWHPPIRDKRPHSAELADRYRLAFGAPRLIRHVRFGAPPGDPPPRLPDRAVFRLRRPLNVAGRFLPAGVNRTRDPELAAALRLTEHVEEIHP